MNGFYEKNLREAFGETLLELGELEPRIVVLDADLCTSTYTHLFRDRFPKRFFQCGISEANMFSVAAALAAEGYIPFPSTFASFAARRAIDNIYMHVCCNNANVKIPGSYAGLTATECGPSHNSCEDIGVFNALPNMRVLAPGDNRELHSAMHALVKHEGPVYFRIEKAEMPVLFGEGHSFQWGKGYVLKEGKDVAILSTGSMTAIALAAADRLNRLYGISARVVHMPSIKPIDEELICETANQCGTIITLENGRIGAGFGNVVCEVVCRTTPVLVYQMGISPSQLPGSDNLYNLLRYHHLLPEDIADETAKILKRTRETYL